MAPRDIYGRKPTSDSRGRTHERILQRQHTPGELPGLDRQPSQAPEGSLAYALHGFNVEWVATQPVTARRGYERTLIFLLRDLADHGDPDPDAPASELGYERLVDHYRWRIARRLDDPTELKRSVVHFVRIAEWLATRHGSSLQVDRSKLGEALATLQTQP